MPQSAASQLAAIDGSQTDEAIALLIAEALLESDRQPYCFGINHDVRAPNYEPCPYRYDWRLGGTVGIETDIHLRAKLWITHALIGGYDVFRASVRTHKPESGPHSIKRCRVTAEYRRRPDDDIPF